MIVGHARTHIYIGWATLYPIGRVILLQQKALYNVVNLSLDIYVCVNFDSPHTSYSLTIYTHAHKFARTVTRARSVHVYMSRPLILDFLSHSLSLSFSFSLFIGVVRA